jgi:L-threonate 2-dehydrogenase
MQEAIGITGVGAMGSALVSHLLDQGLKLHVRDIRPEALADAAARGAVVCASAADLAQRCRVLVILVVDAVQIDEVLFGDGGAFGRLQPKSLVFLCSTIAPTDAERFAAKLKERGVFALDAPISGGPAKVLSGTMSMMLAAQPAALSKAASVLPFLTENVFHVSDRPGDGARFKLLNNMLAATNLAAGAEVMALGMKMGLANGLAEEDDASLLKLYRRLAQ